MKMAPTFFMSLVLATAPLAAAAADGDAAQPPLAVFEAGLPVATPPALYSFADVYRLAVAGDPLAAPRWIEAETQLRLASRAAPEGPRFSVSAPRDGGRWALVLAGLAACAWVAHRRLTSPY